MEEEKLLVKRVLCGDKKALRLLFKELEPKLWRYVACRVKNDKDAEELVQDSLIHFLDALPLFSFRSSLWTFLISITKHEVADYWRKKYAKRVIRAVPFIGAWYDRAIYSVEETSLDMQNAIEMVYTKLSPLQRKMLQWKYEDRLSVREIAHRLKLSIKATESQLFRARKAFQVIYTTLYDEKN